MDPIQAATFSAYAPLSRFAEPATAHREQAEDKTIAIHQAAADAGLGGGLGAEAAETRQVNRQEAAPGGSSGGPSTGDDYRSPDDGGKGHALDVTA
jgi:hypothetical protein